MGVTAKGIYVLLDKEADSNLSHSPVDLGDGKYVQAKGTLVSHVIVFSRYLRTLEKHTEIDQREQECMQADRNLFLFKAVENYIKCLKGGNENNLRIFRLTSLWFNNVNNELVNEMIQVGMRKMILELCLV